MKNGWLPRDATGLWVVNSTGCVTVGGRVYAVAVLSDGHASMTEGVARVEHAAREAVRRAFKGRGGSTPQGRGELRDQPPTSRTRRWRDAAAPTRAAPARLPTARAAVHCQPAVAEAPLRGAGNCATGHRRPRTRRWRDAAAPTRAAPARLPTARAAVHCQRAAAEAPLRGAGNCATGHRRPRTRRWRDAAAPTRAAPARLPTARAAVHCQPAVAEAPLRGAGNCATSHRPPAPGVGGMPLRPPVPPRHDCPQPGRRCTVSRP
ncbi:hypothetical protein SUDANB21_01179 [Streptomyces sp. enrichment culture]